MAFLQGMKIHLISIGGAVMHNMALALQSKGYEISGSDDEIYEPAKSRLEKAGLLPQKMGWDANSIYAGLDAVILGMHARADNPELIKAKELGLKIFSFPEYMYEQTRNKKRIVIGGSHGKTSTTAMILHALKKAGKGFDYLVGSQLEGFDTMVGLRDDAELAVFEGDEYLSSALDRRPKFHLYHAEIGIITGIAWDHINVFPTYENYCEQFRIFAEGIPAHGKLIYCASDSELNRFVETWDIRAEKIPYTTPESVVSDGKLELLYRNKLYSLKVFGSHNLQNLMAAMHACKSAGISETDFLESMADFTGTAKRLEKLKETEDSLIFRDFAHAPSKLIATVNAVRELHPERKILAVYELHTYSSLNKEFLPHYKGSMAKADFAAVLFSKHALEMKKMPMLSEEEVASAFGDGVVVFSDKNELRAWIESHYTGKENLLLMSSGTFDGMDIRF